MSDSRAVAPSSDPITAPAAHWTGPQVNTLAVFCSDGRFGHMTDQLLTEGLKIANYDVFAVPGGPGWLTVGMFNYKECDVAGRWIDALIQKHGLERIVLIAHEDCAFYKEKYQGAAPLQIQKQQIADLHQASERVGRLGRNVQLELYYADIVDERVTFKRVK